MSFEMKVNEFISSLHLNNPTLEKQLIKEIIKYLMKISDGTKKHTFILKNKFSRLGRRNEIDRFQNEYLNISYYVLRELFPALVAWAQGAKIKKSEELRKDVEFCFKQLSSEDIMVFKEKTRDHDTSSYSDFNSFVGGDCWIENYDKLYSYIRSKVGKLSFVLKEDPSLDMEDCVHEILLGIIKVYNLDPKAFCNKKYVDAAISNHINTMLNYYTRSKRKRYYSDDDDKYQQIKFLKKKKRFDDADNIKSTLNSTPEYYATLCDSEQMLNSLATEEKFEDRVLLGEILEKAKNTDALNDYFQILLNNHPDFERWTESKSANVNCFSSLCREAKKYIGSKYKNIEMANWSSYVKTSLGAGFC